MCKLLIPRYRGRVLKGKRFQRFFEDVCSFFPKAYPATLQESIRHLVGSRLTAESIDNVCWRLAGNEIHLRRATVVLPWKQQSYAEWVPVQVVKVSRRRGGRRGMEHGFDLEFKILAGSPCGMTVKQWWSTRKAFFMARFRDDNKLSFGFSRRPRDTSKVAPLYPFKDARQFVMLRCLALISPEESIDEPDFHTIAFTPALAAWNLEQQKLRARLSGKYTCPKGFPRDYSCVQCIIGYMECRAAVHQFTFVKKTCMACGEESYFDPADRVHKMCIDCVEKLYYDEEKT